MARRRKNGHDDTDGIETEANEAAARGHNVAYRAETIRETCEEIAEFDRQIDSLKAERKAVIETRIVADLGMKKGDFALAYKLHQLDESERGGLFDTLRECFAALGVGEQLDWIAGAGGDEAAAAI